MQGLRALSLLCLDKKHRGDLMQTMMTIVTCPEQILPELEPRQGEAR